MSYNDTPKVAHHRRGLIKKYHRCMRVKKELIVINSSIKVIIEANTWYTNNTGNGQIMENNSILKMFLVVKDGGGC